MLRETQADLRDSAVSGYVNESCHQDEECQSLSLGKALEAVSKILAEQDEETAKMHEAEIVGGMIFIADHQPPEVA